MISSAKRWAIVRAESSLAASLYCLPSTWGLTRVMGIEEPAVDDERGHWSTESAPKATMAALAGAPDHSVRLISCGEPGVSWGERLLETRSKMPALARSL